MPSHNASDLAVAGTSSSQLAQLQQALNYIDAGSPTGSGVLDQMESMGVKVVVETDGSNSFHPDDGRVYFDPNNAIVTFDANGNSVSAQSPALGLIHEGDHAINPNLKNDIDTPDPQYTNAAETRAIGTEDQAAAELGESPRDNHYGKNVAVSDPTEHVTADPNTGQQSWVSADGYNHGTFTPGQGSNNIPGAAPDTFPQYSPPANPEAYDPREFDPDSGQDWNQGWADAGGYTGDGGGGGGGGGGSWGDWGDDEEADTVKPQPNAAATSHTPPRGFIQGTSDNSLIVSNVGGDTIAVGSGQHTVAFNSLDTSPPTNPDLILNFKIGGDNIDLTGLHLTSTDVISQQINNGVDVLRISDQGGNLEFQVNIVGIHEVPLSDILR